jgi:hypothetical protein
LFQTRDRASGSIEPRREDGAIRMAYDPAGRLEGTWERTPSQASCTLTDAETIAAPGTGWSAATGMIYNETWGGVLHKCPESSSLDTFCLR